MNSDQLDEAEQQRFIVTNNVIQLSLVRHTTLMDQAGNILHGMSFSGKCLDPEA